MTENMMEIKQADRNNFCETSMDSFDRFQEVQNVWRMENGRFVLKFQPFTETWSPEQRHKKAGEILSGRYITFCAFEGDMVKSGSEAGNGLPKVLCVFLYDSRKQALR